MKRVIIVETLLFVVFCVAFGFAIRFLVSCSNMFAEWNAYLAKSDMFPPEYLDTYRTFYNMGVTYLCYGLCVLVSSILTISAMIFIAASPLPGIKPLVEKVQAKREARANLRSEKAEANRQRRIEELQAELNELKKDE